MHTAARTARVHLEPSTGVAGLSEVAQIILAATQAAPVRTVDDLAQAAGLRIRSLQRRFEAAQVAPKAAVGFVICMQILQSARDEWPHAAQLIEFDPRTSRRLMHMAHFDEFTQPPTATEFIARQTFIRNQSLLIELARCFAPR
jgi:hypothetical protein